MNKVYEFPEREVIEQEAAEWLVQLDGERVPDDAMLARLREWMQRSPAHREELLRLNEFWSDQSLVALPIALDQLCHEPAAAAPPERQPLAGFYPRGMIATMASLLVLFSVVLSDYRPAVWQNFWGKQSGLYASAIGEQRSLELADGSTVYLNTNSQVKIDFGANFRDIYLLQGEAYFEVAKQPARPFRVFAGRGRVQAVGTAFTVRYHINDDVDITVTEGTVALAVLKAGEDVIDISATQKVDPVNAVSPPAIEQLLPAVPVDQLGLLKAGQVTTILIADHSNADSAKSLAEIKTVSAQELDRRGSWRSGLLIFSGNTLEEVVAEVSRYTPLSIDIVEPQLKSLRIGGRFSVESPRALFDALEANFGLRITQLDYQRVEISSAAE